MGFSMGVLVYGVWVVFFYSVVAYGSFGGSIMWVFPMGLSVFRWKLGLRHRLLWFWVFSGLFLGFYLWVLGGFGVEV